MSEARRTQPAQRQHHHPVRIASAGGAVIAALAYLAARLGRKMTRLQERRERAVYWRAYSDVLADLGGIDGEASGDITGPRQ